MSQYERIAALEKDGWEFVNWISAHDPGHPEHRVAVMSRSPRTGSTHYREVNPDGGIR
jgi:hypothetical protein